MRIVMRKIVQSNKTSENYYLICAKFSSFMHRIRQFLVQCFGQEETAEDSKSAQPHYNLDGNTFVIFTLQKENQHKIKMMGDKERKENKTNTQQQINIQILADVCALMNSSNFILLHIKLAVRYTHTHTKKSIGRWIADRKKNAHAQSMAVLTTTSIAQTHGSHKIELILE